MLRGNVIVMDVWLRDRVCDGVPGAGDSEGGAGEGPLDNLTCEQHQDVARLPKTALALCLGKANASFPKW